MASESGHRSVVSAMARAMVAQQAGANGWQSASGDTSWADREQQARSQSDSRFGAFQQGGFAHRFAGGRFAGGGGARFGGGGARFGGFRR